MKKLFTLLGVLLLAGGAFAQTHKFPALDTANAFTGANSFPYLIPSSSYTVATLPMGLAAGNVAIVIDGNSSSCTSGGGSTIVLCYYDGANWSVLGGGGGGSGTVTSVSGTANHITVATGTTTPALDLASPLSLPNLGAALLFNTDNTLDIGAAGATRPRTAYLATSLVVGNSGSNGQATFSGASSGTATVTAQSAAGTPTLTLPTSTGTFVTTVGAPFSISSTTGQLTCCTGSLTYPSGDSGQLLAPSAGTSAPAYSFAASTGNGIYLQGSNNIGLVGGGSYQASVGSTGFRTASTSGYGIASTAVAGTAADTGISRDAAGILDVGNGTIGDKSGLIRSGNTVRVASDFTTAANTSLQTITGLSWTFPGTGTQVFSFQCFLTYSQATANAAVAFGIQAATNAPTAINAKGIEGTSLTAYTTGTLRALNTTTATAIVSATPSAFGAIGTAADMFSAELSGTIENPATTANTINIMVSTATSGDAVTVYRGSYCTLN